MPTHPQVRARTRFSPKLDPRVVSATHGWWQDCKGLSLPGYVIRGASSANLNAAIDGGVADPIGGSMPLKSYICQIGPIDNAAN